MALPKSGGVRKFPARYIHLNIRSLDEVLVNRHATFAAESISPPRDAVLTGTDERFDASSEKCRRILEACG
jgi:hypothetical protein